MNKEYCKTFKGRMNKMYRNMKNRFENVDKYNIDSICSKEEFVDFINSHIDLYTNLYYKWKENNYQLKFTPTVDRINYKIGYDINNIQLLSWEDNNKKSNEEYNKKPPLAQNKKKIIIRNEKEEITFDSGKDACDYLEVARNAICIAIKNQTKVKGYNCNYK